MTAPRSAEAYGIRRSFTYTIAGDRLTIDGSDEDDAIRIHAASWCGIVGVPEEKTKDVGDLVVRTQRKWRLMCAGAGSALSVGAVELDGLREWRRDELGRIVGLEAADALIAGIKAKQGF